jgi:alpha-beta hydrolase superfamily lysophospholipase
MAGDSKTGVSYSMETVPSVDGLSLFCRRWNPPTEAIASVIIVHGIGEHSGRYVHVGRYFAEAGIRAIALDLRGHGRSPGRPVFAKHYRELAADVDSVVQHFQEAPTFLFGHSFGGQLVLWTAQHFQLPIAGLMVSSPWLALSFSPPRWQLFVAQKVNRLFPGLRFATGIHPEKLSRDQLHLDSLEDLDLLHKFSTVRFYLEAANAASEILSQPSLGFPVLFAYGDADEVTSCRAAEEYFLRIKAPSKTFKLYPGLLHELHNEKEREQVLADYLEWMKIIIKTESLGPGGVPNG